MALTFTHLGHTVQVRHKFRPVGLFGAVGMALFNTILLRRNLRVVGAMGEGWVNREAVLVAHEFAHSYIQFKRDGWKFFPIYFGQYLRNLWAELTYKIEEQPWWNKPFHILNRSAKFPSRHRKAYWEMPYEIEARAWAAKHWQEFVPIVEQLIAEANVQ